jgi:hypothetical protein
VTTKPRKVEHVLLRWGIKVGPAKEAVEVRSERDADDVIGSYRGLRAANAFPFDSVTVCNRVEGSKVWVEVRTVDIRPPRR